MQMFASSKCTMTASLKFEAWGRVEAIQPCSTSATPTSDWKIASVHQWHPPPNATFCTIFEPCF
jgi:hypothetical protein